MLARPGATLTKIYSISSRDAIKITAGPVRDVLPVAQVTFRAYRKHRWIYEIDEVFGKSLRQHRMTTYAITDLGRREIG